MSQQIKLLINLGLIVIFSAVGCGKKEEVRSYTEIVIDSPLRLADAADVKGRKHGVFAGQLGTKWSHPPLGDMPMGAGGMQNIPGLENSVAQVPLTWKVPAGWTESKGSGMRLVSFQSSDPNQPIDCSIVSLSGVAGGVKANIIRWLGQLQLETPSEEELDVLLKKQPKFTLKGKLSGLVIDFAQLQTTEDDQTNSILAAIVELPESTIFVKMTGSKAAIQANKEKFTQLYQSLQLNSK